jgi:AraC family transcriptional regulator of adaptative response / DNA-3-methyladenine glycosylase II
LAVQAIIGQQNLIARLVKTLGTSLELDLPGVTHAFPTPMKLRDADLQRIGLADSRAQVIRNLARAISENSSFLDSSGDLEKMVEGLKAITVRPSTAQYIAMRAFGEPDAFPAQYLELEKALAQNGRSPSATNVSRISEAWRPFRAYAAIHLWSTLNEPLRG